MNVCGIDPSISGTAICLGDVHGDFACRNPDCHVQFPSPSIPPRQRKGSRAMQRMQRFERTIEQIMDVLNERPPALVLIEGYSFGSTNRAAEIGEFGGLLRWHLTDFTPLVYEVAPCTMHKFLGVEKQKIKGDAKQRVASAVKKRYGETFENDDLTDAYCYFRMGFASLSPHLLETRQRQALKTVYGADPETVLEAVASVSQRPVLAG